MIGKNLEITPTEALFLMILHRSPELSGVLIVKNLTNELGEDWCPSPGSTYKTISSLLKKGLVYDSTAETGEEKIKAEHSSKYSLIKTYCLTSKGEEFLPKITNRLNKIILFAKECCSDSCHVISSFDE